VSAAGQAPAPVATAMDWASPPFFMLRVGGLPTGSVAPLRSPALTAWADRVLALEHELALRKVTLGNALEAAVGRVDDVALRRQLLAFRRDVFNVRPPRGRDAAARIGEVLERPAARAVAEWLALQARRSAELAQGEPLLADEVAAARRHLRALADDPRLRAGIMLASPSLDRYLAGYTDAKGRSLSKRARRIERSLLEYVYRTACKTSPFSTFTAVALGRFGSAPDGRLLSAGASSAGPASFTRLNLASIARVVEEITAEPLLRADLPVEVTSGWRSDAARVRYVRRQRRAGDADAAVTMDILQENLFYLAEGGIVAELLRELPEGVQMRFSGLVERLRRADADARDAGDVAAYLAHLLRLGLLTVPVLHVDIHHPDPLTRFSSQIAGLGRPWADRLSGRLNHLSEHVGEFGTADLAARRRLLADIRDELTEAQRELGRAAPATPRTLVYEDVTLGDAPVIADRDAWERQLLPSLRGLCRILPAFDMTLPGRLLTAGFFRARFGAGGQTDDVLTFAHEFNQDCYEQFMRTSMQRRAFGPDNEYLPQQNWFRLPEIDALDHARQLAVTQMRASYAALPPDAGELVLDDDFVAAVADALPEPGDLEPRSFFLQVADDGTESIAVVNRIYSGLTLLFSRFAHCFPNVGPDGLTAGLRRYLARIQPPGSVFAELTGGYDTTNLNLHPATTLYELVCPGDVSSRPAAEQIPVADLLIVDDEETGRPQLRSRRLGVRVIPVYLGFLMPFALPEVQRVLLTFSYNSMAMVDLWGGVAAVSDDQTVMRLPRIRLGNVVLQRQQWRVSPAVLPTRKDETTEAEWFLSWRRWQRENGLPERVFVSSAEPSGQDRQRERAGDVEGAPLTKPQHIDFGSYFSLTLLDGVLRSAAGRLVMTEMLPELHQLWLASGQDRYVTELTLELDGVKRSSI
jgi:hypothetical protein